MIHAKVGKKDKKNTLPVKLETLFYSFLLSVAK